MWVFWLKANVRNIQFWVKWARAGFYDLNSEFLKKKEGRWKVKQCCSTFFYLLIFIYNSCCIKDFSFRKCLISWCTCTMTCCMAPLSLLELDFVPGALPDSLPSFQGLAPPPLPPSPPPLPHQNAKHWHLQIDGISAYGVPCKPPIW